MEINTKRQINKCNNRRLKALYYATGIDILKMAFKIAGNYVAGNHDLLFLGVCTDLLQHKLNATTLISTETRCDANVKVLIYRSTVCFSNSSANGEGFLANFVNKTQRPHI